MIIGETLHPYQNRDLKTELTKGGLSFKVNRTVRGDHSCKQDGYRFTSCRMLCTCVGGGLAHSTDDSTLASNSAAPGSNLSSPESYPKLI